MGYKTLTTPIKLTFYMDQNFTVIQNDQNQILKEKLFLNQ